MPISKLLCSCLAVGLAVGLLGCDPASSPSSNAGEEDKGSSAVASPQTKSPDGTGSGEPPRAGEQAPAFELESFEGETVSLADRLEAGPVVLVLLRGYPGYQCPICSRQFGELVSQAEQFDEAGASVLLVYPSLAEDAKAKAAEFLEGTSLPSNFDFLLDPAFRFTNAYDLRWDAPKETAYPAAFVVDQSGTVRFAKVSDSHGGRASADELLQAVKQMP